MKTMIMAMALALAGGAWGEWGQPVVIPSNGRVSANETNIAANAAAIASQQSQLDELVAATNNLTSSVSRIESLKRDYDDMSCDKVMQWLDLPVEYGQGETKMVSDHGLIGWVWTVFDAGYGRSMDSIGKWTTAQEATNATSVTFDLSAYPELVTFHRGLVSTDRIAKKSEVVLQAYPYVDGEIGSSRGDFGSAILNGSTLVLDNNLGMDFKRTLVLNLNGIVIRGRGLNDYGYREVALKFPTSSTNGTILVSSQNRATEGVVSSDIVQTNSAPLLAAAPRRGLLAAPPPDDTVTTQRLDTARAIVDYSTGKATSYTDSVIEYALTNAAPSAVSVRSGEIVTVETSGTGDIALTVPVDDGRGADFVLRVVAPVASQIASIAYEGVGNPTVEWLCDPLTATGAIAAGTTNYVFVFRAAADTYAISSQEVK